jgi:hypothetical protein
MPGEIGGFEIIAAPRPGITLPFAPCGDHCHPFAANHRRKYFNQKRQPPGADFSGLTNALT